jgi:hypothetical protein
MGQWDRTRAITAALTLAALPMLVAVCGQTKATDTHTNEATCRVDGQLARLAQLPEASGVTVSRRVPGRLWTHNDSGQPVLFMLDARGGVTGRIQLSGATVDDWEAISAGACPTGSCLYVGDIGDNNATRDLITVYRLTEPGDTPSGAAASTAAVDVFHARYPDGAHDAETLLVTPDAGLYIVTKGSTGPVAIYRFPGDPRPDGRTVQLQRIGQPRSSGPVRGDEQITDGAVSSDGARVVLRTHEALYFYRTAQLLAGNWSGAEIVNLKPVGEAQGEGVAFGANNEIYLVGEGGGSRPGSFAHLTCAR